VGVTVVVGVGAACVSQYPGTVRARSHSDPGGGHSSQPFCWASMIAAMAYMPRTGKSHQDDGPQLRGAGGRGVSVGRGVGDGVLVGIALGGSGVTGLALGLRGKSSVTMIMI